MATAVKRRDPKWQALRKWLREGVVIHKEACSQRTAEGMRESAEWHAGYAVASELALMQMSMLSRAPATKKGAKKR